MVLMKLFAIRIEKHSLGCMLERVSFRIVEQNRRPIKTVWIPDFLGLKEVSLSTVSRPEIRISKEKPMYVDENYFSSLSSYPRRSPKLSSNINLMIYIRGMDINDDNIIITIPKTYFRYVVEASKALVELVPYPPTFVIQKPNMIIF